MLLVLSWGDVGGRPSVGGSPLSQGVALTLPACRRSEKLADGYYLFYFTTVSAIPSDGKASPVPACAWL